jgi:hypothetical protein
MWRSVKSAPSTSLPFRATAATRHERPPRGVPPPPPPHDQPEHAAAGGGQGVPLDPAQRVCGDRSRPGGRTWVVGVIPENEDAVSTVGGPDRGRSDVLSADRRPGPCACTCRDRSHLRMGRRPRRTSRRHCAFTWRWSNGGGGNLPHPSAAFECAAGAVWDSPCRDSRDPPPDRQRDKAPAAPVLRRA